eukprot:TRINITY_DN7294_c0_g1_i1.p2 TRINITY_DN7294_c0_g1~~TRINITY_DN7294_c0_g1_i1.p2  ORF type:complete len:53 (-),score=7.45 TRINITY_DN7294_c0_g1_i1:13-171(-)
MCLCRLRFLAVSLLCCCCCINKGTGHHQNKTSHSKNKIHNKQTATCNSATIQ